MFGSAPDLDVMEAFLTAFGMETLRDLPDIEALEDAGLLILKDMHADADTPMAEAKGDEE